VEGRGLDKRRSGLVKVAGCCEHGNEPQGFNEMLGTSRPVGILKNDLAPWGS